MNSNQRRKLKREFPFPVRVECDSNERYFEHDEKVHDAKKWCRKNLSNKWSYDSDYYSTTFKFSDEKNALMFALRWA